MNRRIGFAILAVAMASAAFLYTAELPKSSAHSSERVYELRTYTTNDGKMNDLHARFRDHTNELFVRHGMTLVGYWSPTEIDNKENILIYMLAHDSRDAAKASWKGFVNDPDWKEAFGNSRKDGPLLSKAPDVVFMSATDYSPLR